ncbi:MAG: hypothetical protein WAK55_05870 [Xanthobacteraceae bacterium]
MTIDDPQEEKMLLGFRMLTPLGRQRVVELLWAGLERRDLDPDTTSDDESPDE